MECRQLRGKGRGLTAALFNYLGTSAFSAHFYGEPQVKKGPLAGPMWKVEDCPGRRQRKQKRRLRTSPLELLRFIITSKMTVNWMARVPSAFHGAKRSEWESLESKENILERGQHGAHEVFYALALM
jgi:hypothetical protein